MKYIYTYPIYINFFIYNIYICYFKTGLMKENVNPFSDPSGHGSHDDRFRTTITGVDGSNSVPN